MPVDMILSLDNGYAPPADLTPKQAAAVMNVIETGRKMRDSEGKIAPFIIPPAVAFEIVKAVLIDFYRGL